MIDSEDGAAVKPSASEQKPVRTFEDALSLIAATDPSSQGAVTGAFAALTAFFKERVARSTPLVRSPMEMEADAHKRVTERANSRRDDGLRGFRREPMPEKKHGDAPGEYDKPML